MVQNQIQYSEKYFNDAYEDRHVVLPLEVAKLLPKNLLLSEKEWRAIGVQQSYGWLHYAIHQPDPPHNALQRPLNYQQPQENNQHMVIGLLWSCMWAFMVIRFEL